MSSWRAFPVSGLRLFALLPTVALKTGTESKRSGMNHTVIMAGGSGTRFWPASRKATPKQLLRLVGDRTMIQMTSDRVHAVSPTSQQWVVTNAVQAEKVKTQLPEIPAEQVLVEPAARNTAPCVGLAAIHLLARDPNATMLVLPADQVIQPNELFCEAASRAFQMVEENPQTLALFGVVPTYPAVGFGYIERGESLGDGAFQVSSFREKPDLETARSYVDSGTFYWNCGIFVWRASTIMEMLKTFEPEIERGLQVIAKSIATDQYDDVVSEVFPELPSISIDYAVLERASDIAVIEAPFEWDDIGSWQALPRLNGADEAGNTVDGDHIGVATENCIIRAPAGHTVASFGVNSLIIVHTPDVTLVADRNDETGVKRLVEELKARGMEDLM